MTYTKHLRDYQWDRISHSLPGKSGDVGVTAKDNRRFVEGVIWVGRNGGRWRSLPVEYGKWSSIHKRFKTANHHDITPLPHYPFISIITWQCYPTIIIQKY